ncbi:MAG: PstS family phosphate ABC transporter substrate-binding protein [Chloroflexia bacterium]|nr:PstS family phosphate ABC transporter substrate-binding protein [Chloroflexia bacterium]
MVSLSCRSKVMVRGALTLAFCGMVSAGATVSAFAQDVDRSTLSGDIVSDGSSTVGPVTQAVAEEFSGVAPDVRSSVDISGTGGGFERFCNGETDLQNASRPIAEDEIANCEANGVEYLELPIAIDGLTVVVNSENDFLECLTTDELQTLWRADDPANTWADLNPEFPDETIALYGPGTDSGTFDYFVETILGDDIEIRQDFTPSEDDNVLVEGVAGDANALGYFGYIYYIENQDALTAVAIDGGDGCVLPTAETVEDGSYAPLSRPLFIYMNEASLERPEVQEFARFYIEEARNLVGDVGYNALPEGSYAESAELLEAAISGESMATPDA